VNTVRLNKDWLENELQKIRKEFFPYLDKKVAS